MSYDWLIIYEDGTVDTLKTRNEFTLVDVLEHHNKSPIKYIFGFTAINKAKKRAERVNRMLRRKRENRGHEPNYARY